MAVGWASNIFDNSCLMRRCRFTGLPGACAGPKFIGNLSCQPPQTLIPWTSYSITIHDHSGIQKGELKMSQPYVGEVRPGGWNFAPAGWALCQGQLLPISENETLFQLIGTTYGGDGQSTFGLPDFRGRLPLHQGNGHTIAEQGGTEEVTLTVQQLPGHSHSALCVSGAGAQG